MGRRLARIGTVPESLHARSLARLNYAVLRRSATRSSATESTIQRKRRSGELLVSLSTQRIFSSFIHARGTASPLIANFPRTFSLFFRHLQASLRAPAMQFGAAEPFLNRTRLRLRLPRRRQIGSYRGSQPRAVQKRRSRKFGRRLHSTESHFPYCDFWTEMTSGWCATISTSPAITLN